jgi:hypothetical protein
MSRARDLGSLINSTAAGKNLVFNGDMNISQRGTTATSVASDGYYVADRWLFQPSATGTWTVSKENDAPTGSGIATSLKILCTTAQASLSANAFMQFNQHFEGQYLQKLKKGSSSAETTVLSFWVKSNVTGTYVARIYDATNVRAIHQTYTISAANTWEKKIWLISGDTVGALNNDINSSLRITFWLAGGSTYNNSTPNTTWSGYNSGITAGGQVNLASAVNNYFQFTGVQWEIGSSPTQFSLAGGDIQGELAKCQRYYQRWNFTNNGDHLGNGQASGSSSVRRVNWPTKVIMRANPSIPTQTGTIVCYKADGSGVNLTTLGYNGSTPDRISVDFGTSANAGTAGDYIFVLLNSGAYFEASAEL